MFFFDDNNYALREGDPTESGYQRLLKKRECDRCALSRGLAKGEPGNCTPYSTVSSPDRLLPDLYAALAATHPEQVITL